MKGPIDNGDAFAGIVLDDGPLEEMAFCRNSASIKLSNAACSQNYGTLTANYFGCKSLTLVHNANQWTMFSVSLAYTGIDNSVAIVNIYKRQSVEVMETYLSQTKFNSGWTKGYNAI